MPKEIKKSLITTGATQFYAPSLTTIPQFSFADFKAFTGTFPAVKSHLETI